MLQAQSQTERKPNRLVNEKSPYLLQHAYNPVDWYPWGLEALDKAKAENKPIFLSIGYSTCHWCHVMEKECFEDPEVAQLLNDAFVCIKVDREERPDLDAEYMAVCQAMGRSCGWPLNVILTPKMNPFFAASYIPKYNTRSSIGMLELIPQVVELWKLRRNELEVIGFDMKSRIEAQEKRTPDSELGKEVLDEAYEMLSRDFDDENGGFGRAPKFPRPHTLMFLLRYWKRTGEKNALAMAEKTLAKMRQGGIYDQLGFGFHRYSTDSFWLVPHFEKMLYDQALLTLAYLEAFQATGARRYAFAAKEILEYTLRDLASPTGGFYSGQDADTEGEEGKYYLWTTDEALNALPAADAELAFHVFGLKPEGNFTNDEGKPSGKNVLNVAEPFEELAPYKGLTVEELVDRVHSIRDTLFSVRKKRIVPSTDDKILVDWNGLIIAALARAGKVLGEPRYVEVSQKTADFVLEKMREHNLLYHRFAKGERAVEGFLDDYAFFAFGLFELYEATFEDKYLLETASLTKDMVTKFWDEKSGGFFQTQKIGDSTIPRLKQVYDGAIPSGNSMALLNLLRLGNLAMDQTYQQFAVQLTKAFSNEVQGSPESYTWLLAGIDFTVGPNYRLLVVGNLRDSNTIEMLEAANERYNPNLVVSAKLPEKAGYGFSMLENNATAFVCHDQMCLPPTNSIKQMLEQLGTPEGNH